jgi:UDP-N-acetylmuramoylalanine-D-glutamate ligase
MIEIKEEKIKNKVEKSSMNFQNYDFVVYELSSYMLEDLQNHHSFISII